jgi:hypothetical protein
MCSMVYRKFIQIFGTIALINVLCRYYIKIPFDHSMSWNLLVQALELVRIVKHIPSVFKLSLLLTFIDMFDHRLI